MTNVTFGNEDKKNCEESNSVKFSESKKTPIVRDPGDTLTVRESHETPDRQSRVIRLRVKNPPDRSLTCKLLKLFIQLTRDVSLKTVRETEISRQSSVGDRQTVSLVPGPQRQEVKLGLTIVKSEKSLRGVVGQTEV